MVSASAPRAAQVPASGDGPRPGAGGDGRAAGGDGGPTGARWLDAGEREAWLSLVRVMIRLPPQLDAQLEREAGVNLFEYSILAMLSEQPDRTLRMSRLAAVTNASPSRLSHAARHLEGRGWIRRESDPGDGRGVRAVLTPEGHELVADAAPGHVATVRALVFDALSPSQVRALLEVNERILLRVDPEGISDPGRLLENPEPTAPVAEPTTRRRPGREGER